MMPVYFPMDTEEDKVPGSPDVARVGTAPTCSNDDTSTPDSKKGSPDSLMIATIVAIP
jgi:hypothetical protein